MYLFSGQSNGHVYFIEAERRDNNASNKNKGFSRGFYDPVTAAMEQLQPQKLSDILCSRFINEDPHDSFILAR